MKKLNQFVTYFLKYPFPILLGYAVFERDKFMNGIYTINWILLLKVAMAITAIYCIWSGMVSIKKWILNNKRDEYWKKEIEKMVSQKDAHATNIYNTCIEEKGNLKEEINRLKNIIDLHILTIDNLKCLNNERAKKIRENDSSYDANLDVSFKMYHEKQNEIDLQFQKYIAK